MKLCALDNQVHSRYVPMPACIWWWRAWNRKLQGWWSEMEIHVHVERKERSWNSERMTAEELLQQLRCNERYCGRREAVEIMDELWRKRMMKMKENGDSAKRIAPKRPWDLAEFLCIRWNIGHFRQHVVLTTYNITRGDPNLLTLLTATTPYLTREACPSLSCLALLTSQMHYVNVYGPPWLPVVVDNIMWIITFLILAYKTFKL